jgi:hypothetical protein
MKYLLLVWKGVWGHDGPDHGRRCLFDSPEDAKKWMDRAYRGADGSRGLDNAVYKIVPVVVPPDPETGKKDPSVLSLLVDADALHQLYEQIDEPSKEMMRELLSYFHERLLLSEKENDVLVKLLNALIRVGWYDPITRKNKDWSPQKHQENIKTAFSLMWDDGPKSSS